LLAILPKIYKSGVHKEKGFSSIFEYSFKLAGLSEALVKKALKLDEDLQNKPCLQKAIETQGIHKVALVAKIATPETDRFFADKVENMSKSALNELSKEIRGKSENKLINVETVMKIPLDEEMQFLFLKLKKEIGKELSNKEVLRRILKKMAGTSQMMAKRVEPQKEAEKPEDFLGKIVGRYIPVMTKRTVIERTGGKCAHENCNKPYEVLHHMKRWAVSRDHKSIVPLCKGHHEFAHNGLLKNDGKSEGENRIDGLFKKYRQMAIT
ncbi:MAG: hypothetical protein WC873_03400, partial [Candidatus Gracilibacteria bacterium]